MNYRFLSDTARRRGQLTNRMWEQLLVTLLGKNRGPRPKMQLLRRALHKHQQCEATSVDHVASVLFVALLVVCLWVRSWLLSFFSPTFAHEPKERQFQLLWYGVRLLRFPPARLPQYLAAHVIARVERRWPDGAKCPRCGLSRGYLPWQRLYFLPEPHGQGSLRPTLSGASRLAPGGAPAGACSV
jgi:hypothetical protein